MPNNKYILGTHDKILYPRTWILHYRPGIVKPGAAELYTELFRFQSGYYQEEVDKLRKLSVHKRDEYVLQKIERMGYSLYQNVAYKKFPTGLMCIEIKAKNAIDYMAKKSLEKKADFSIADLRDDMEESTDVVACCVNAAYDGILVIFRINPDLREESHQCVVFRLNHFYGVKVESSDSLFQAFPITSDPDMFIRRMEECTILEPELSLVKKKRWDMSTWQDAARIKRDSFEEALLHDKIADVKYKGKWGFFIPSIEAPTADKRLKRNYKYSKRNKELYPEEKK